MRGSGRGRERGGQGRRRGQRGRSHSTFGREGCPEPTFTPPENNLASSLSVASVEGREETVYGLKRELEEIAEEITS